MIIGWRNKTDNSGIYCIENKQNGMKYIGKGKHVIKEMTRSHKGCYYIYNAIQKYGKDAFIYYVIEYCEIKKLIEREQHYIKEWNTKVPNGYNLTDGGDGAEGRILSAESREKMRIGHLGKTPMLGKHHSDESKEKIRIAKLGILTWLGKHHSDESKEKIRVSRLGKKASVETKEKQRIAMLGKTNSPETKEKKSLAGKNAWKKRKGK